MVELVLRKMYGKFSHLILNNVFVKMQICNLNVNWQKKLITEVKKCISGVKESGTYKQPFVKCF